MTANAEKKQSKPWQFKKGQSGNPKGKRPGTRHRVTLAVEALLDGEAEALTRKAVELALEGDTVALRLCLERLCPPRKDRPLDPNAVRLPTLKAGNLAQAQAAVARALAGGRITPSEAEALARVLEQHRRAVELSEIVERIAALEETK